MPPLEHTFGVRVRLQGEEAVEEAIRLLAKKSNEVKAELFRAGQAIASEAKKNVRRNRAIDTGTLRNYILADRSASGERVEAGVVSSKVPYAPYVEFGTKPHFPPPDALEKWAKRHRIPLFPVLLKIAREGTPPRPFLRPAVRKIFPKLFANIKRIFE